MKSSARARPGKFVRRYRTMIAGFNVYRLGRVVSDAVRPPRIHTVVHGMMIDSDAEVVSTGEYGVLFKTNPRLLLALSHTGMAFVESPLHGMLFRARVLDVRERQNAVALTDLELVPEIQERRSLARVAPLSPVFVQMSSPELDLRGRVADLSAAAMAADFGTGGEISLFDLAKSEVSLIAALAGGSSLELRGRIRRIHPTLSSDATRWRVVVGVRDGSEADRVLKSTCA